MERKKSVLADSLGIAIEDTIAIGDSENDMEMLKAAGIGIAMGNADEKIKKEADEITESIRDEGVYQAFLRILCLTIAKSA